MGSLSVHLFIYFLKAGIVRGPYQPEDGMSPLGTSQTSGCPSGS